jgi:hypothetical protein
MIHGLIVFLPRLQTIVRRLLLLLMRLLLPAHIRMVRRLRGLRSRRSGLVLLRDSCQRQRKARGKSCYTKCFHRVLPLVRQSARAPRYSYSRANAILYGSMPQTHSARDEASSIPPCRPRQRSARIPAPTARHIPAWATVGSPVSAPARWGASVPGYRFARNPSEWDTLDGTGH